LLYEEVSMSLLSGPHAFRSVSLLALFAAAGLVLAGCGASADGSSTAAYDHGGGIAGGGGNYASGGSGGGYGGAAGAGYAGPGGAYGGSGGGGGAAAPGSNTNVNLGGSQDFGYFRKLLDAGQVPHPGDFDASGFFAEHYEKLPPPSCGHSVCLQPMLGVMNNLYDRQGFTLLQFGLNSPLSADPGSRPPLDLEVAVDVSGSMGSAGKIDFVRQGLNLLVDGLKDGDRFGLVTYSTDVHVAFPMADITGNRQALHTIVNGLTASGGTNFYGGLERGFQELQKNYDSGKQNRVILLSDGQPTSGDTNPADILAMSKKYNSDGIGLTTIGLGTSFNAQLMSQLALQADGNYYFLEDSGAVSDVFTEELNYFTVPIAYDLTLRVHAAAQYSFGQAYGSPFWQNTSYGAKIEVPSLFLAHRQSASDVTKTGGRRGGGSALLVQVDPKLTADDGSGITDADVAVVDVTYREPGTNNIVYDTVTVHYPDPPWSTRPEGYFDATDPAVIEKSFLMLNIYLGLSHACDAFWNKGDTTEAIAGLDRLAAAANDYNTTANSGTGDDDIKADVDLMTQLRAVLITNGAVAPTDSKIPADPWPAN
jgi:Ca-activated chloride channel family protein